MKTHLYAEYEDHRKSYQDDTHGCIHCGFSKHALTKFPTKNNTCSWDNYAYSHRFKQPFRFFVESYHARPYRRDPDTLKNFIPLSIPASIVPSLQCYKEYNHKRKERTNIFLNDTGDLEDAKWPDFDLMDHPRLVRTASSCYVHSAVRVPATLHEVEFHERIMPYRTQGGLVTGHNY